MKSKNIIDRREKIEAIKTALRAIGPIEADDDMEMAIMRSICTSLNELRLYIEKGGNDA